VLVVQATGWGKSAVYWAATAVLRAKGARTHADRLAAAGLMRDSARPRRALVAGGAVGPYIFSILVGETTRYNSALISRDAARHRARVWTHDRVLPTKGSAASSNNQAGWMQ
jgi:hypothetical protein